MKAVITPENLRDFAYTNLELVKNPRGIAVEFIGLGNQEMQTEHNDYSRECARSGVVRVVPYLNPWNWMSAFAAHETDEILDAVRLACGLGESAPVVSTGGSMGGLSAIVYMVRARVTPVACVANCPVCDLPAHYHERPDLPRTLYSAYHGTPGCETLEDALRLSSPIHLIPQLPRAAYTVFHCTRDEAVNKALHSDRFVKALREKQSVEYIEVENRGHCDLTSEARGLYEHRVIEAAAR